MPKTEYVVKFYEKANHEAGTTYPTKSLVLDESEIHTLHEWALKVERGEIDEDHRDANMYPSTSYKVYKVGEEVFDGT